MRGSDVARGLLTPFLGRRDAAAVVADLEELSAGRGPVGSRIYFWSAVAGYPIRILIDAQRDRRAHRRGGGDMEEWTRDAGYAARSLRRSPAFTVLAIAILAGSMGAATAIFSVVDGVLLDPLPLDRPEALRSVWIRGEDGTRHRMTPGNVSDLRTLVGEVFQDVAAFQGATAALTLGDGSTFVRGGAVTPGYLATLGVRPVVGRAFRPDEARPDAVPVVVLGQGLWERAFGSDPAIVGRTVELSGVTHEVVGVAPKGVYPTTVTVGTELPFSAANQDYFVPLVFSDEIWDLRRPHVLGALARLAEGVTPERSDAALETLSTRLQVDQPFNRTETLVANPFVEEVVGDVRFALWTLLGTLGLVLLVAVVNVGALFLLRGDDRASEIDIRRALGASSPRLARQLLVESSLVVLPASLGAIAVAHLGIRTMQRLVPYQIPRLDEVRIDALGLGSTLAAGALLAFAFGVAPAWRMFRASDARGDRSRTATRAQRRLHAAVVGVQAALGVVVLVGALLLTRSFAALRAEDPGFSARDAWVIPVSGAGDAMPELVRAVRDLPGIAGAALAYDHPLERNWGDAFLIEGRVLAEGETSPSGSLRAVGDGYFDVTGIETLQGRIPDAVDLAGEAPLAVVNQSLRDAWFPDGDAVGAVIRVPTAGRMFGEEAERFTVAAVVADVRFLGPDRPSEPAFYLPLSRFPVGASTLLVRAERPGVDVVAGVRGALREVAPGAALQSARRLEDVLSDLTARPRFNMMLLVSFAAMGLILCGLGAYGLVGRAVVRRLREVGIRMALGADRRHLVRSVVGTALRPVLIGGALGIGAAWGLGRLIRSLLYGIGPDDPVSFVASALFLVAVGVLAAVVPAARALAVDPARTLREE